MEVVTGLPRSYTAVTDFYAGAGAVGLGNVPSLSFLGQSQFSFEAWIYLDALVDQMPIFGRQGEFLFATKGPKLYAARTNQIVPLTTEALLEEHTWYHVALTFDGVTMAVYVNGLRRDFVTLQDRGVANQGQQLTIGGGYYGWLDSARVWNVPVPPGAVYEYQWLDYPSGTTGLLGQIDFSQWPPVDSSGSGAVTITPSATGVRPLMFVPAAELSTTTFCDPYNDSNVNPGGTASDFSVMAWISPTQPAGSQAIFSNGELGGAGTSLTLNQSGTVTFQVGSVPPITSTGTVPTGAWTNVACTWAAATGAAAIYVNGQPDTTGTMPASGTLASGAPLIGAAASSSSALPVNSFIGFIQSVSLWSYLLSAAQVTQYMTSDPLNDANCIADWDLMPPRAQNSVSLNPLGLVGGADVREITTASTSLPDGAKTRTEAAPAVKGILPSRLDAADWSPEMQEAMVEEFRVFMTEVLGIDPAHQDEFAERLRANLHTVGDQLVNGTLRIPYELTTETDEETGISRIHLTVDGETSVIYEGELDACTTWAISFIITVGMALYTVFGFVVNLSSVNAQLTNYLGQRINNIGLLPQLRAVFTNGPSATAVYQGLRLLWDFGLLTGIMKFLWQAVTVSVSIWTIISLGTRLVLLFGPFAPLEIALFITELGLALVAVYNSWNDPNNCWKSGIAIPSTHLAVA